MSTTARVWVRPTDGDHRVTTLELFFDLVFVFAFTQVTSFMSVDFDARTAIRGLIMLAVLWFAWCSYSWLGNQARADEGIVRVALLLAMVAIFVAALAIPQAWTSNAKGLNYSLVIAVAVTVVRLLHLGVYRIAAGDDKGLRRTLFRAFIPVSISCALLIVGGIMQGSAQSILWIAALLVDYGGIFVLGGDGWRLISPNHFAERYGLIMIVAIGESIVAVGLGVTNDILTWPVMLASVSAMIIAICLWWTYFDVVALVAERVLHSKTGSDRTRMARDSYTYLHFPMVLGIIYLALGFKKVLTYVSDSSHYSLSDSLSGMTAAALYGGVALYLLGHIAFRLRNIGTLNRQRFVVTLVVLALIPYAMNVPALVAIATLAGLLVAVVTYEAIRFGDVRDRVRHSDGFGRLVPESDESDES